MCEPYQASELLASPAFEALCKFIGESLERGAAVPLAEYERDLRERFSALESQVLGRQLALYDVSAPSIKIEGTVYRRKHRSKGRYCGIAGEFEIERWVYVPQGGGRSVCPLELQAGIVEGHMTPRAAQVSAQAVAYTTPKEAHDLFVEVGGMCPSTSTLDRIPKRLSEKWEGKREYFHSELREQESVPREAVAVAISIDGVLVPMKDCGRIEKRESGDKRPQGPAGFREVGCGTVTLLNEDGERLQTVRYGRQPEENKAMVKLEVEEELESILKVRRDLKVVALADGARENWEYFRELAKRQNVEVIEAVDFFHVCERLKKALDAFYGEQSPESKAHFEQLKILLKEKKNGPERVIRALISRRKQSKGWRRKTIDAQLKYFRRYRKRMPYQELWKRNLPIGSGVVEAACKTLASARLKRSGMAWRLPGVQAILTLRSLLQSERWSRGWELLAAEYRRQVQPLAAAG